MSWKQSTMSSSSAPAAPVCAQRSRHSTSARTSRSSPSSTPCAATPARPRAGSTPRSGTPPRTTPRSTRTTRSRAPTTSATRTRSRSSRARRSQDLYQLENWGCVFSRTEDGRIAQRPFGAAGAPRTAYAADITGHVLIQVLYEQMMRRDINGLRGVLRLEARGRRRALPGRDLLGPRQRRAEDDRREDGHPRHRRRRPALPRDDERVRVHRRRDGDGAARRRPAQGHGVHAVSPDDALPDGDPDHRGLPRRGRIPDQQARATASWPRYAPNAMELASRDVVSRSEQTEIDAGPRGERLDLPRPPPPRRREDPHAPAQLTRAGDDLCRRRPDLRADPRAARRPLPHGRRRHGHARARPSSTASTRPARSPASRCTARTGWAATR